ncbi:unnamed protein product [Rotaria sp. Silwood1]|nr:unnamed protein product [Rotaria sp. Silwood1]
MPTDKSVDNNSRIQSENNASRRVLSCTKVFFKQLIARKPMDILQAEIDTRNELRRDLNWIQLLAIGLGATIGAGIFVFSGQAAAKYSGPSVIISFLITGIITFLSSLSYAELGAMMPISGSAYTYAYAGIFCAALSGICPVDILGKTTAIGALITYTFVHITVIVMRFTHRDMQRIFQVPFGSWLIPTIDFLLCMILMKGIADTTAYRFLVWTALGQLVYFSYGFWHSKRRKLMKGEYVANTIDLVPTIESIMGQYTQHGFESDIASDNTESAA